MSGYKDLAIEEAVARIADLEHDLIVYRELAVEAIHALHHVTRQRDRLRCENRALREQLKREAA